MSQARSSRGARGRTSTASRAMPAQRRGVYVQPARSDVFVVLLGVSLGAMLLGCLFLVLKLNQYGFQTGGPG